MTVYLNDINISVTENILKNWQRLKDHYLALTQMTKDVIEVMRLKAKVKIKSQNSESWWNCTCILLTIYYQVMYCEVSRSWLKSKS